MTQIAEERLYHLLPAIYRIRDTEQGEPMRALLAIIEREMAAIQQDMDGMYDDWFIETCREWVVPYIGDLLGVRGLNANAGDAFSLRGYVANTLGYRRRKGTIAVVEQLARDVTGWPAKAVEYFQLLGWNQNQNHIRRKTFRTPDFRDTNSLELLGGPFETATRTAEVRRIAIGRGKYNIPNVGVFLWRLQPYTIDFAEVSKYTDGRYRFSPLGNDIPLFNQPNTELEIEHLAEEVNVAGTLRRRPLYDELEARRASIAAGIEPDEIYFDDEPPIAIYLDGSATAVPPEQVAICNLSGWEKPGWPAPKPTHKYRLPDGTTVQLPIAVAVDPVLGRIAFPALAPHTVEVKYAYGFSGDMGGGPYDRHASLASWYDPLDRPVTWQLGVNSHTDGSEPAEVVATLLDAVKQWNTHVATNNGAFGVIAVMDNAIYNEDIIAPAILIPAGCRLAIVAANWPKVDDPENDGIRKRRLGQMVPTELRPCITGEIDIKGGPSDPDFAPGEVILDGLLISGSVRVLEGGSSNGIGGVGRLRIAHCTLVPGIGLTDAGEPTEPTSTSLSVDQWNGNLRVEIDHSITGPLKIAEDASEIVANDSIIDSPRRADYFPVVVSGYHDPFVAIGVDGTVTFTSNEGAMLTVNLAQPITTLAKVADALQAGLNASPMPVFHDARVVVVLKHLVIVPGTPVRLTVTGTLADQLRLTKLHDVRISTALRSGHIGNTVKLTSTTPKLIVRMAGEEHHVALVDGAHPKAPKTLLETAHRLHAAIRAASGVRAFAHALVTRVDDQLLIIPGIASGAPALIDEDATTLYQLKFDAARPAIASDVAGGHYAPPTSLERCTIFGTVWVKELELASEVIFNNIVRVLRRQSGCARFSYIPPGSATPRRFRCQPDLEISATIDAQNEERTINGQPKLSPIESAQIAADISGWLVPAFTATQYGNPAYAQLHRACPVQIATGAEDGSEMGAFSFLKGPQRLANLRAALDEYLRFGLEAGIVYAT